jgi:Ca2+/Na+ antiporter
MSYSKLKDTMTENELIEKELNNQKDINNELKQHINISMLYFTLLFITLLLVLYFIGNKNIPIYFILLFIPYCFYFVYSYFNRR